MTDGIFGLETDWQFTYLNETARTVVCNAAGERLTIDELLGRNISELLPEARDTTFETEYREAMRTREVTAFDDYYEPLDVWFEVRVYPSETGLTVCFRHVTERRQRRERLETREAVLRKMYDTIADCDAGFEERVDDLLRIGQRVLGTPYGTLSCVRGDEYVFEVVRSPGDIEVGDVVDLWATNCEWVVLTAETLVLANVAENAPELTDKTGYDEWGITCYLGTPVVVDDEVYGTFCFYDTEPRTEPFSDWEITLVDLMGRWVSVALERKLVAERLRRQNDRLEKFATLVSHDFRNPLNVADGWLDVASEDCGSEAITKIQASHDRMRTIVDEVLALARAGQTVDDPTELDLGPVAADAWEQVATGDATLAVDLDLSVRGDRPRLQRLFENLFRNSVEHGSTSNRAQPDDSVEHGSPSNRTEDDADDIAVRVGALSGGFYVEDDGVGIPADRREHILEFGFSTADDGTGIGLGVVEDIADAHGWTVRVTESASGGARFEFTTVT
jgi:nitrogen-specific signal transduction histidine kinase